MVRSPTGWQRTLARAWPLFWVLMTASVGIHSEARAVGPPLDLSGDWEAIPGVFQSSGGPYHRLHFELQSVEALPVLPGGVRSYEARYTGQLTYFETRHFYQAPAGCDLGAIAGPGAYETFPRTYSLGYGLNVTSYWTVQPDSGVIRIGSIEGLGQFNSPAIPRPHGDFDTRLLFSFHPGAGQEPVDDTHARLRLAGFIRVEGSEHVASDRCSNTPFGTGADHGQMSFWRVSAGPAELAPRGTIRGRLVSTVPVLTSGSGDEVQRASVQLFRQDELVRVQRPGESDDAYRRYLDSQTNLAAPAATLTPDDQGRFRFDQLPLFARAASAGLARAWFPQRYLVRVVSAETDEMAFDSDANPVPGRTNTVVFLAEQRLNLLADTELEIGLRPNTAVGAKRELIADLSRLGPVRYAPLEARASTHLDALATQGVLTEAQDEGLRRALWAERVVRDGARYADTVLDLGLTGLAVLLADALGDLDRWEGAGVAAARKQLQKVRDTPRPGTASGFDLDSVGDLTPAMRRVLERGRSIELADEMIKMIKALRPVLQETLISRGVAPDKAKLIAVGLEQAMLGLLNVARNQTARGAAKDALKAVLKEYLDDTLKPALYDGVVPYSFTALTAPSLEYSVDHLIQWNRSDQAAYLQDRDRTVEVLTQLGNAASDVIARAILLQAGGDAADLTQKYAGLAGLVPPARAYAAAVEKFAKAAKYVANGVGIIGPAVYAFAGGPHLVSEGVHAAFGNAAPTGNAPSSSGQAGRLALAGSTSASTIPALPPLVLPAIQPLLADLQTLDGLLQSNRVAAAIHFAAGSDGVGLGRSWEDWLGQVARLELGLQAYAVPENRDTFSLVIPHAIFYRLKSALLEAKSAQDEALQDWFLGVLGGVYTDAADLRSLAAAGKARAMGRQLRLVLEAFPTELRPILDQVALFRARLPALYLEWEREATDTDDRLEIVRTPQRLPIRVRAELLGATNLTGVDVTLRLPADQEGLHVVGESTRTVRFSDDSGGPAGSAALVWELEYDGQLRESSVFFDLEVRESGEAPSRFAANSVSGRILIAPAARDRDLDGLPDAYEAAHGLKLDADDHDEDLDADGISNGDEFLLGTRPDRPDSDGDGLSDREELLPGIDGVVSSPTRPDSDADGVADPQDPAPYDPASAAPPAVVPRVPWGLDRAQVILTRAQPLTVVQVQSDASGELRWFAEVTDSTLAQITPGYGETREHLDSFLVGLPAGFQWPTSGTYATQVRVRNAEDPEEDSVAIAVWVQADFGSAITARLGADRASIVLEWDAVVGRVYVVESSGDLRTWTKSTVAPVSVSAGVLRWSQLLSDPGGGVSRFYRVLAQAR